MIDYTDSIDLKEAIKKFDEEHLIKQVILIGNDGTTRNIEFDIDDDTFEMSWEGEQ